MPYKVQTHAATAFARTLAETLCQRTFQRTTMQLLQTTIFPDFPQILAPAEL